MRRAFVLVAVALAVAGGLVPSAADDRTTLVGVGPSGAPASSRLVGIEITPDGGFVAFSSAAAELVPGDVPDTNDVFVHDTSTGITELVNRATDGSAFVPAGYTPLQRPAISDDGRYIVFTSYGPFVPEDTNGYSDLYLRDRQAGTTSLLTRATDGGPTDGGSGGPSISADGTRIAFTSSSTNLVDGDANARADVFVLDRSSGTTMLASVASNGTQGNFASHSASISADGAFVAFVSRSSNIAGSRALGFDDVFVRDIDGGRTTNESIAPARFEADGASGAPSLSGDGRHIAFTSTASNLTATGSNRRIHVYVRDRSMMFTSKASIDSTGNEGINHSWEPRITRDGRFVTFTTAATNIVYPDTNGAADVIVHDRSSGATYRASVAPSGEQAKGSSGGGVMTADASAVFFLSNGADMAPGLTTVHDRLYRRSTWTCSGGTTEDGPVSGQVHTSYERLGPEPDEVHRQSCRFLVPNGL